SSKGTLMAKCRGFLPVKAVVWALSFAGSAMAQSTVAPPAVSVIEVMSREVTETGEFIGRVTAIERSNMVAGGQGFLGGAKFVARVPGFIEERKFVEGQLVKKGDLLFRIEQATYKANVEQQRANLARAKATEANARIQLERGKELVHNQNISQATLDQRAADQA